MSQDRGPSRILVIDDDPSLTDVCQQILRRGGHSVQTANSGEQGCRCLQSDFFDLVLTDLKMPGLDGLDVLRVSRETVPDVPVILFTGYPTVETAVEAIKKGAFDYLTKPFSSEQLLATVERALTQKRLVDENRELRAQVEQITTAGEMVGTSPAMLSLFSTIRRVAPTNASVLVVGETGTGKELVARNIHLLSARHGGPFVPVDCAALPENLLESELFGHERGAFTDAVEQKVGLIETAHEGTLFLDEIGEMPLGLQVKLLRVLQDRRVRRIGGRSWNEVDFRLVAATNRELERMVSEGRFREDLFYRVNVVRLRVPALRERRQDIPLLASHFVKQWAQESRIEAKGFTESGIEFLKNRDWPGNVRELENVIERAVHLMDKEYLGAEDLELGQLESAPLEALEWATSPESVTNVTYAQAKRNVLDDFERRFLVALMTAHAGNVSTAARTAEISRTTLQKLLRKHRLDSDAFRHHRSPSPSL